MSTVQNSAAISASDIAARLAGLDEPGKLREAAAVLAQCGNAFHAGSIDALYEALRDAAPHTATIAWAASLPATIAAHYLRARLFAASDPALAAESWTKFFSLAPCTDPMLYLEAARTFARAKQYGEAARHLREALSRPAKYSFFARSESLVRQLWRESPPAARRCRIAIVGSSTTNLMVPVLRALCFRDGIDAEFYEGLYGAFRQEVLSPESGLHRFRPDFVFLANNWRDLNLPALSEDPASVVERSVSEFKALWTALGDALHCHVVQHTFDRPGADAYGYLSEAMPGGRARVIRRINEAMLDNAPPFVSLLDLDSIAAEAGAERWSDPLLWNNAKQHPALEALPALAEWQIAHVRAALGLTRKVLICDLDNTLWGGVIGEDGLQGIRIGPGSHEGEAYADLQRYLLDLKSRGILLAVCSKNNPEDARLPFEQHPSMALHLDDFVAFEANWDDKATNLRRIARKLSLGLDSFVFIDDNPLERAWVRSQIPEIAVVEVGNSPHYYVRDLARRRYFYALTMSAEDRKRSEAYRTQVQTETLRESALTVEAFLEQLNMTATVVPVSKANIARVTQLTNKTNQFNLTTRRYTEAQVRQVADHPANWTGVFQLADRFGDHGIIGVIFCKAADEPATWEIDTWLMSCRVLGRQMEEFMFDRVVQAAAAAGVRRLKGVYHRTAKSVLVADLYPRLGFSELTAASDEREYEFLVPENYTARCSFIQDASPAAMAGAGV